MPPAGLPRLDMVTMEAFASVIEQTIHRAAGLNPNPGSTTIHRLNRTEYTNVIRDLLAVEIDSPSLLPADDSYHGFDNLAGNLSVSPVLLERYFG
jgi:hypothetical protein